MIPHFVFNADPKSTLIFCFDPLLKINLYNTVKLGYDEQLRTGCFMYLMQLILGILRQHFVVLWVLDVWKQWIARTSPYGPVFCLYDKLKKRWGEGAFGTEKFVHYNRVFVITEFAITEFHCSLKNIILVPVPGNVSAIEKHLFLKIITLYSDECGLLFKMIE